MRISGLIVLVLVCPLFGVVEPGVGEIIRQMAFSLLMSWTKASPRSAPHPLQVVVVLIAPRVAFWPHSHSRATYAGCHS